MRGAESSASNIPTQCITDVYPRSSALEDILRSGNCPVAEEFLVLCVDCAQAPQLDTDMNIGSSCSVGSRRS
jgi:hypothetical protein